jgi:hypothetical protein
MEPKEIDIRSERIEPKEDGEQLTAREKRAIQYALGNLLDLQGLAIGHMNHDLTVGKVSEILDDHRAELLHGRIVDNEFLLWERASNLAGRFFDIPPGVDSREELTDLIQHELRVVVCIVTREVREDVMKRFRSALFSQG